MGGSRGLGWGKWFFFPTRDIHKDSKLLDNIYIDVFLVGQYENNNMEAPNHILIL